jgi:SAM-dependent methyltransferase
VEKESGRDWNGRPFTELERIILDRFSAVLATQERFEHFRRFAQAEVKEGVVLASIPCGLMADLLDLDYQGINKIGLVGIDLDADSLAEAKKLAEQRGIQRWSVFRKADAWNLPAVAEFSVILSNGLNIYEPDDVRVTELYRRFFNALKPGGLLRTRDEIT